MKTDLAKILSVRGQRGLFSYIAQSRNGAIAEKMKEVLGDADAPSPKASPEEIKALFEKALPDYDGDRFYVSHMKKVVEWYNQLKNFASLDFVEEEEEAPEAEA